MKSDEEGGRDETFWQLLKLDGKKQMETAGNINQNKDIHWPLTSTTVVCSEDLCSPLIHTIP